MGRTRRLMGWVVRFFKYVFTNDMSLKVYGQWTKPIGDWDLIDIGFSYFGPNDWYNMLFSIHVTLLGIKVVWAVSEDENVRWLRNRRNNNFAYYEMEG